MSELFAQRFLARLQTGNAAERAEVVRYLGELYSDIPPGSPAQSDLAIALVAVLDDPSPAVRATLSDAVCHCRHLPLTVLLGLAEDASEVAEPLLTHSPSLSESWLIDFVGSGQEAHRRAIARRKDIGVGLAAAIAALADAETCCILLRNEAAAISHSALATMVDRHRADADLRVLLLRRPDLPTDLRRMLIEALTDTLALHVVSRNLMPAHRAERVFADAEERALIEIGDSADDDGLLEFAAQLHEDGVMTVSMLLRAIVDGRLAFFEAALAVMAAMPLRRVRALLREKGGRSFGSLYRRTGLDPAGQGALAAALDVVREEKLWDGGLTLSRRRILERVLSRYESVCGDQLDPFLAMLARSYADEARRVVRASAGGYFNNTAA